MKTLGMIGAGSWATALVKQMTEVGCKVQWFVRRPEARTQLMLKGELPEYLPGVQLPLSQLALVDNPQQAAHHAEVLFVVVPTVHLGAYMEGLKPEHLHGHAVCTAIKGLVPGAAQLVSEYFHTTWGVPHDHYAALLGPGHAEEVAAGHPTYLTACSKNEHLARTVAETVRGGRVHCHHSTDVEGAELASALKNVYAMAAGIAQGLGYGDNFQSVLITNALGEMEALLEAATPAPRRVQDSLYGGDLLVTAYSPHSRNRRMGQRIGQGESIEAILQHGNMVAEGYYAAQLLAFRQLPRLPILTAVQDILAGVNTPAEAFKHLEGELR